MDGGWLTAEGIAMEVGLVAESVYRSLWRWYRVGHVETRQVLLAYMGGANVDGKNISGHMEARREWKTI